MFKVKHERTADCVVAGYRLHKGSADAIGSLLLGLYDGNGDLANIGVIGAFPMATRTKLFTELQPLVTTFDGHPWDWERQMEEGDARTPRKAEGSRLGGRQGPALHAAASRAGGRDPLRPHGGDAAAAHGAVRAVASRPRSSLVHVRPARRGGRVRPRRRAGRLGRRLRRRFGRPALAVAGELVDLGLVPDGGVLHVLDVELVLVDERAAVRGAERDERRRPGSTGSRRRGWPPGR